MDPISLNVVRAAAADVAAGTSGTSVAAPAADISGASAEIAADARAAALVDAAADTAVVAADARAAALTDAAADVAAAVDSAGDIHRHACRVRHDCDLHVPRIAQGMAAVGPVRAPVELLYANETTHQLG